MIQPSPGNLGSISLQFARNAVAVSTLTTCFGGLFGGSLRTAIAPRGRNGAFWPRSLGAAMLSGPARTASPVRDVRAEPALHSRRSGSLLTHRISGAFARSPPGRCGVPRIGARVDTSERTHQHSAPAWMRLRDGGAECCNLPGDSRHGLPGVDEPPPHVLRHRRGYGGNAGAGGHARSPAVAGGGGASAGRCATGVAGPGRLGHDRAPRGPRGNISTRFNGSTGSLGCSTHSARRSPRSRLRPRFVTATAGGRTPPGRHTPGSTFPVRCGSGSVWIRPGVRSSIEAGG